MCRSDSTSLPHPSLPWQLYGMLLLPLSELVGNSVQTLLCFQLSRGRDHAGAKTSAGPVEVGVVEDLCLNDVGHGVAVDPRTHVTQEGNGGGVGGTVARRGTGLGIFWNQNRIDTGDIGTGPAQWGWSDSPVGLTVVGCGLLLLEVLEGGVQQGVSVVNYVPGRWSGLRVAI